MTGSSKPGRFISIDGPSGIGKSSTAQKLSELLRDDGIPVHLTAEPSSGQIGELARNLTDDVRGLALACLYARRPLPPHRHRNTTRSERRHHRYL